MITINIRDFLAIHEAYYKGKSSRADSLADEILAYVNDHGGSACMAPAFGDYRDETDIIDAN